MSVEREHAADLATTISSLVNAGLPIEEGLAAAARELPRGPTAKALDRLTDQLRQGQNLEHALDDRRTPAHLQALVAAGLRSAALGRVLEEFVAVERHADDVHRRIRLALSYPAVLVGLMSGLVTFFAATIVPGFAAVYKDFDADLPISTRMLIEYSSAGNWVVVGNLAVVVGAWLLILLAMRVPDLRTILLAAPLLGPILRWASLARFARLLALLVESELPLPSALRMAASGCHDRTLEHAAHTAAARVEAGWALSDSLASLRAFPESLAEMLRWSEQAVGGESRTALCESLRVAAEMFEGRLEAQLALLRTVLPPLTFLFVLWGSLFLVAAIIMPMVSLIDKLS